MNTITTNNKIQQLQSTTHHNNAHQHTNGVFQVYNDSLLDAIGEPFLEKPRPLLGSSAPHYQPTSIKYANVVVAPIISHIQHCSSR